MTIRVLIYKKEDLVTGLYSEIKKATRESKRLELKGRLKVELSELIKLKTMAKRNNILGV